jgi:arginyl-tRNA synthetase
MREILYKLILNAVKKIGEKYNWSELDFEFLVEPPPIEEFGDYSSNIAFILSKKYSLSPTNIATDIKNELIHRKEGKDIFEEINIEGGGFLNFKISPNFVRKIFKKFKPGPLRNKKFTVFIEYSSPNIGKPLSIAHIRSTIIGDSLARIYKFLGYRVITDNHLGDWGLQAGIIVAACKKWKIADISKISMQDLLELYIRYNSEMEKDETLREEARLTTLLLQKEDKEVFHLWKKILQKSLVEFNRIYKVLGVKFDYVLGESKYRKELKNIVDLAIHSGVAKESEGAIVIPISEKEPPLIIKKQDGGYLYATFDLAAIRWRKKKFNPKLILYVVSNEQTQYLNQIFKAAEMLGWIKPGEAVHVKFGLMRGEDLKRLSTRKGKIFLLEDVINEAISRCRKIVEEKNPSLSEKEVEKISRVIAIGALKYNDLVQHRNTDIIFDWNRILDLKGNSAPYIQYTFARLRSITRKARNSKPEIRNKSQNLKFLKQPEEIALMKKTLQFPEAVENAAREYAPNLIANYLWELSNLVNTFYEKYPVLKAEKGVREARLFLISRIADVLKEGLGLLGIEAPERV